MVFRLHVFVVESYKVLLESSSIALQISAFVFDKVQTYWSTEWSCSWECGGMSVRVDSGAYTEGGGCVTGLFHLIGSRCAAAWTLRQRGVRAALRAQPWVRPRAELTPTRPKNIVWPEPHTAQWPAGLGQAQPCSSSAKITRRSLNTGNPPCLFTQRWFHSAFISLWTIRRLSYSPDKVCDVAVTMVTAILKSSPFHVIVLLLLLWDDRWRTSQAILLWTQTAHNNHNINSSCVCEECSFKTSCPYLHLCYFKQVENKHKYRLQ